jgi:hypothetical protein
LSTPSPYQIAVGDFNHNGTLDLAAANLHANSVSVILNVPSQNERFISEVYHQLLGRPADPGAVAFWNSFLDSGGSRQQMTLEVEGSAEYRANEVVGIYQKYLHRAPDATGWRHFTQLLLSGATVEQVAADIVGSDEYMRGIAVPAHIVSGQPPDDGFVEKLFRDALGRDVDPETLTAFDTLLANHATHAQVAAIVFQSAEYDRGLVQDVFREFLGRDADAKALAFESQQLQQGQSDEQLIAAVVGSAEYYNRLGGNL